jgi:bifunctional DNase/RNase
VLLRDEEGRVLPIAIGVCEAAAIHVRLMPDASAAHVRRPWSHDLIVAMLERLGARLDHVVVDDLANETFFATLHLTCRGRELVMDTRPSDAIALLLRTSAPLLVNEEVMDEAAFRPDVADEDGANQDFWEGFS